MRLGLEQAVEAGDVRAILEVLKGLGLLYGTLPAIVSTDPEEVAEDAELAAKANAARRENARLFAGVGW